MVEKPTERIVPKMILGSGCTSQDLAGISADDSDANILCDWLEEHDLFRCDHPSPWRVNMVTSNQVIQEKIVQLKQLPLR